MQAPRTWGAGGDKAPGFGRLKSMAQSFYPAHDVQDHLGTRLRKLPPPQPLTTAPPWRPADHKGPHGDQHPQILTTCQGQGLGAVPQLGCSYYPGSQHRQGAPEGLLEGYHWPSSDQCGKTSLEGFLSPCVFH